MLYKLDKAVKWNCLSSKFAQIARQSVDTNMENQKLQLDITHDDVQNECHLKYE